LIQRLESLQKKQACQLRRMRYGPRMVREGGSLLRDPITLDESIDLNEPVEMKEIDLGPGKYTQHIRLYDKSQGMGISIFYAAEESSIPYLIFICNGHFVTEYRLLSVTGLHLPTHLYLRLAQAILQAHQQGVVLGPDLNIGNIKWNIAINDSGVSAVVFKNLPPVVRPGDPPRPPPKIPLPDAPDTSTTQSDIYCSPIVLSQMIHKIEDAIAQARRNRIVDVTPEVKTITTNFEEIAAKNVLIDNQVDFPDAIKNNKKLFAIAELCLSPTASARPTAQGLVDMLMKLAKTAAKTALVRDLTSRVGTSIIGALKGVTFHNS